MKYNEKNTTKHTLYTQQKSHEKRREINRNKQWMKASILLQTELVFLPKK